MQGPATFYAKTCFMRHPQQTSALHLKRLAERIMPLVIVTCSRHNCQRSVASENSAVCLATDDSICGAQKLHGLGRVNSAMLAMMV